MKKVILIVGLVTSLSSCGVIEYTPIEEYKEMQIENMDKRNLDEIINDKSYLKESYELIKSTPADLTIEGIKHAYVEKASSFEKAFELKEISSKKKAENYVVKAYQTKTGKDFTVDVVDGYVSSIYDIADVEIILPYGLSTKASREETQAKLDPRADLSAFDTNENAIDFAAGLNSFMLSYEGKKASELLILDFDKYALWDKLVMRESLLANPIDEDGEITLSGASYKLPIKLGEFEELTAGDLKEEGDYDVRTAGKDKGVSDYYKVNTRELSLNGFTYTLDLETISYLDDSSQIAQDDLYIDAIHINPASSFEFKNKDFIVDNDNYDSFIADLTMGQSFNTDIKAVNIYLDDNTYLTFTPDEIIITSSNRFIRYGQEDYQFLTLEELEEIFE